MHIQRLPEEVINRIAAGEVVQSPSAALKELVENSLDSGATRIAIAYIDAGLHTLRVTDNGSGITASNLPLVATRFATSKLRVAEDLQSITTFGFRGEAIAALSYVSFLRLITRGSDLLEGSACHDAKYRNSMLESTEIIKMHDFPFPADREGAIIPARGTTIIVENLFYNASTRRAAFSARKYDELHRMEELTRHYAIANSGVAFSITRLEQPGSCGKRNSSPYTRVSVSRSCADMSAVMRSLYGEAFMKHMIPINTDTATDAPSPISIDGIVSGPFYTHPKAKQFVCFVNKRLVRMPSCLRKVCEQFYQQILPRKHYPYVFLRIRVPSNAIDVNIHPTKSEVRILYEEQSCAMLEKALQKEVMGKLQAQTVDVLSPMRDIGKHPVIAEKTPVARAPPQSIDRSVADIGQMEKFVMRRDGKKNCKESDRVKKTIFAEMPSEVRAEVKTEADDIKVTLVAFSDCTTPNAPLTRTPSAHFTEGHSLGPFSIKRERALDFPLTPQTDVVVSSIEIDEPSNPNARHRDETEERLLSSIKSILTVLRSQDAADVRRVLQHGTYVGSLVDEHAKGGNPRCHIFLQHHTSLYMLDGDLLLTTVAFQHVFWFWERNAWHTVRLGHPISLVDIFHEVCVGGPSEQRIVEVLEEHSEMLEAYFGIGFTTTRRHIDRMPLLLGPSLVPNFAGLPLVLAQIAHTLAVESDEERCLIQTAKALATWFAYRADTSRGDVKGSDAGLTAEITLIDQKMFEFDPTPDFHRLSERLCVISAEFAKRAGKSREEHDYILHHGALATIKRIGCYLPPNSLWIANAKKADGGTDLLKNHYQSEAKSHIMCIATTEALYRVFERC